MTPDACRPFLLRAVPQRLWRWRTPLFFLCLGIFCWGVFRPDSPPELFEDSDKALHVLAFMGLGLCSALAAAGRRGAAWVWPALLLAAPLTEWAQHALQPATRDFSLGDILGNLAGVALAALLWRLVRRWVALGGG